MAAREKGATVAMLEAAPEEERGGNSTYTAGAMRVVFNGVDDLVQLYDLTEKRITRTIPWPRGEEREGVNIRFSPDGGLIRVLVNDLPGRASVDIIDQGPGVAQADRDRVFEPFYRGIRQPDDAVRGTGIGLSIVQEYIVAHGGQVRLVEDGVHTFFRMELPHAA